MSYKDYYKIMGLSKDATEKDIKIAYRKLARKYHPDISKEANAEEKFKELGEAYEVLRDSEKRKIYDQYGKDRDAQKNEQGQGHGNYKEWGSQQQGFQFDEDFLESLFGKGAGFRNVHQRGQDFQSNVTISLEEAHTGVVKEIHLQKSHNSPPQTLRVKIPAGIRSGQQIRLPKQGGAGAKGSNFGDLYITVIIAKHPFFDVVGNDIYVTLPVAPWEVALGATVTVPSLSGKIELKIPPGSQGGQTLRLRNKGLSGGEPGDQFVLLKIVIPKPQTQKEKDLYRRMQEEMPFNPREGMRIK